MSSSLLAPATALVVQAENLKLQTRPSTSSLPHSANKALPFSGTILGALRASYSPRLPVSAATAPVASRKRTADGLVKSEVHSSPWCAATTAGSASNNCSPTTGAATPQKHERNLLRAERSKSASPSSTANAGANVAALAPTLLSSLSTLLLGAATASSSSSSGRKPKRSRSSAQSSESALVAHKLLQTMLVTLIEQAAGDGESDDDCESEADTATFSTSSPETQQRKGQLCDHASTCSSGMVSSPPRITHSGRSLAELESFALPPPLSPLVPSTGSSRASPAESLISSSSSSASPTTTTATAFVPRSISISPRPPCSQSSTPVATAIAVGSSGTMRPLHLHSVSPAPSTNTPTPSSAPSEATETGALTAEKTAEKTARRAERRASKQARRRQQRALESELARRAHALQQTVAQLTARLHAYETPSGMPRANVTVHLSESSFASSSASSPSLLSAPTAAAASALSAHDRTALMALYPQLTNVPDVQAHLEQSRISVVCSA